MPELEKLKRAPVQKACIGSEHNTQEIEEIIMDNRWPKADCRVCGGVHLAAIRKIRDTLQGGEFQFVEPECPNVPAEKQGE